MKEQPSIISFTTIQCIFFSFWKISLSRVRTRPFSFLWLRLLNEPCYCVFGKDFPKIKATSHFDSGQGPKLSSVRKIAFTIKDWKIFDSIKKRRSALLMNMQFPLLLHGLIFSNQHQTLHSHAEDLQPLVGYFKLQFVNLEIKVVAEAPEMKNSSNFQSHMLTRLKCNFFKVFKEKYYSYIPLLKYPQFSNC